jgi:hypothetical protein
MPTLATQRLADLGVPAAYHAGIAARRAPRFHTILHLGIILASIAAAIAAMVAWSRYVDVTAENSARAAHALLYDSDIGAGSLGLLLTALLASGWLCGAVTWRRGSESARNGWAADLMHVPAKNKAVTDWLWRRMIRRHASTATSADDFLDRLGGGVVRDLGVAAVAMLGLTALLGATVPARISYATEAAITDHSVPMLAGDASRPVTDATAVICGCPTLPKDGNTLIYQLRFSDGAEANIGAWRPLAGSRLSALEAIASRVPAKTPRERFSNPIGSKPISTDCLKAFAPASGGLDQLMRLLAVTDDEKARLKSR